MNSQNRSRQYDYEYMSPEERRRIIEIKRRRAKKRRRARLIRFIVRSTFILFLMIVVGIYSVKFVQKISSLAEGNTEQISNDQNGDKSNINNNKDGQEHDSNPVMQYNVEAPKVREENEIISRLKNLSETYPDFKEIYENRSAYPKDLISSLCNNPEMIDFVKGYLTADRNVSGGLTKKELSSDFPLLLQWDKRWGYKTYGDNDIALSGCAPTCLSMVIVALTKNKEATPNAVADFAMKNGYYIIGTGTKWSLMTEAGQKFGIQGRVLSLSKSSVISELENGHPIICSLRPGDFTTTGHFIVLVGTQDGKIRVNDPNCRERSNTLWDYDTLEHQIKNLWSFTQN